MHLRRMNKARKHLTAPLVPSPNDMGEDSETASGCPRDAPSFPHYLSVTPVKLSQEEGEKGHFPVPFTKTSDSGPRSRTPSKSSVIPEYEDPSLAGKLEGMSREVLHIVGTHGCLLFF